MSLLKIKLTRAKAAGVALTAASAVALGLAIAPQAQAATDHGLQFKAPGGYGSMNIWNETTGANFGCFQVQANTWVNTHLTVQEGSTYSFIGYGDSNCQSKVGTWDRGTVPNNLSTYYWWVG